MKVLSRDFTLSERILLLLMLLFLVGLGYYQFVWKPVTESVEQFHVERDALQVELAGAESKLNELRGMQLELDNLDASLGRMESYNNVKAEIALLNEILKPVNTYNLNFSNVSRNGDQIRRNISLSFTASNFETVQAILNELNHCKFRCVLGDIRFSADASGSASVSFSATFFETMYGGTSDIGLTG